MQYGPPLAVSGDYRFAGFDRAHGKSWVEGVGLVFRIILGFVQPADCPQMSAVLVVRAAIACKCLLTCWMMLPDATVWVSAKCAHGPDSNWLQPAAV